MTQQSKQPPPSQSEDGHLETRQFPLTLGRSSWIVLHEKLLKIDFHYKKAFENSKFHKEFNDKLKQWEALTAKPSVEALQLILAKHYLSMGPKTRYRRGTCRMTIISSSIHILGWSIVKQIIMAPGTEEEIEPGIDLCTKLPTSKTWIQNRRTSS